MQKPEDILDAWLGGEEPPSGANHAIDPELADLARLGQQLRQLSQITIDPTVQARVQTRIMEGIRQEQAARRKRFVFQLPALPAWRPVPMLALGALALILIAVLPNLTGLLRQFTQNVPSKPHSVAVVTPPSQPTTSAPVATPTPFFTARAVEQTPTPVAPTATPVAPTATPAPTQAPPSGGSTSGSGTVHHRPAPTATPTEHLIVPTATPTATNQPEQTQTPATPTPIEATPPATWTDTPVSGVASTGQGTPVPGGLRGPHPTPTP